MTLFRFNALCVSAAMLLVSASGLRAQQPPPSGPPPRPDVLLKVDVVLSRWQADKQSANLPFTLWLDVARTTTANLRVGVDVPTGSNTTTSARTSGSGATSSTTTTGSNTTTEYRNIGTSIDCFVNPLSDGRFAISVRLQDSSIYSATAQRQAALAQRGLASPLQVIPQRIDPSAFRTFTMNNELRMRDGQTLQFATATDKITGETLKVDVTINVVK